MTALITKFILFVGLFMGGFLVVTKVVPHKKLKTNNELGGYIYGIIGGIYGIFLAFVVVTVWDQFTNAEKNVEVEVSHVINLYRNANAFPDSVKSKFQGETVNYLKDLIKHEWPAMEKNEVSESTRKIYNNIWDILLKYKPVSDYEKAWQSQAIEQLNALVLARRYRIDSVYDGVPFFMWVVLFVGAFITIVFAYMFGSENKTAHMIMICCLSGTICLVMMLIAALDHPFSGIIRVTPEILIHALRQLNIPLQ